MSKAHWRGWWVLLVWAGLVAAKMVLSDTAALKRIPDVQNYIWLAQGNVAEVLRPFAPRVLHPLMVRGIATTFNIGYDSAFLWVGIVVLAMFCISLIGFYRDLGLVSSDSNADAMFYFVALCYSMWVLFENVYLHDGLYALFLLGCFWALLRKRVWLALGLLGLMHLTRESTYLLTLCLAGLATWRRQWRLALVASVILTLGLWLANTLAQPAPSLHSMPNFLYALLRLPINVAWNLLGLPLLANTSLAYWQETDPSVLEFCAMPLATFNAPAWLPLGNVREVRLCGWRPAVAVQTWALWLGSFGILPVLLWQMKSQFNKRWLQTQPLWLALAWVYGLITLAVAPALGNTVGRYVAYAWVLFLMALPGLGTNKGFGNLNLRIYHALIFMAILVILIALKFAG